VSTFWFTLWQALLTVAISLFLGGGFALYEHIRKARESKAFMALAVLPIFLPTLLVSLGFVSVLGNAGWLNAVLAFFGVDPVQWLYSARAIIAAHVFYNAPLVYVLVRSRLSRLDTHLEDAARVSGARPWRVFWDVTWPRVKSSYIGASVLVFLYAFMSFGVPLVLGGASYATIEVALFRHVQQLNLSAAAMLGLVQTSFLLVVIVIGMRPLISVRETRQESRVGRSPWDVTALRFLSATLLLLPLSAVAFDAFHVRTRGTTQWGIDNITAFFRADALQSWLATMGLAVVVALLTVVAAHICVVRYGARLQRPLMALLAVSPISVSLLLRAIIGPSRISLALVMASLALPVAVLVLLQHWSVRPPRMHETAALLGATPKQSAYMQWQYQLPAMARAAVLVVAFVVSDISISSMLAPYDHPTLMKLSYQLLSGYHFHVAAVGMLLSLATILIAGLLFPLLSRYVSRRF
jgi:thiamine transport system permease protein